MIRNEEEETDERRAGAIKPLFIPLLFFFLYRGPSWLTERRGALPTCLLQISQTIYPRTRTLANSFN